MAQENKQSKQFSVEGLKTLFDLTKGDGMFASYKSEILGMQKIMEERLVEYRKICIPLEAVEKPVSLPQQPKSAPKTSQQTKPASKPQQPQANRSAAENKKVAASVPVTRTKQFDNTPTYVKGTVSLNFRTDRPKRSAAKSNEQKQHSPYSGAAAKGAAPRAGMPSTQPRFTPTTPPISSAPKPKKTTDKKKESTKPFDEKKSMTKRTLIRKGFIQDDFDDDRVRVRKLKNKKKTDQFAEPKVIDNITITTNQITIKTLSELIGVPAQEIMKKLLLMGGTPIKSINDLVEYETMFLVADSFGVTLNQKVSQTHEEVAEALHDEVDNDRDLVTRPPVITVMGHVDHGKTSLLDAIRKSNVVSGEAGGITQHIGAYSVTWEYEKKKRVITFLDTPGHEAFAAMRARGSKVTDIVVLVVAADDGVQPQTIEAVNHAKAANCPVIVAINKIDKPSVNLDRIKEELSAHGLVTDEWGGDTKMVPISAKKNIGIDTLLEEILFLADLSDFKANPARKAKGAIIEARLDKGKGPVASILVQNGTLNRGDAVVCGTTYGKIRIMTDSSGKIVKSAGPSTAVSVTGLSEVPNAGDDMWVVDDEKTAKAIADGRVEKERQSRAGEIAIKSFEVSGMKTFNVIIKADVQGSAEALKSSISRLENEEVKAAVVHCGVGAVNKSDMMLAEVTNALVIGFNVKPDSEARLIADHSKLNICAYSIIYDAIDAVESAMAGLITPKYRDVYIGKAQVRAVFKITDVGTVAGSYILDGKIQRGAKGIIKRAGETIYEGTISGLKRFKDDAKEVAAGFECGISFDHWNDFVLDDEIEAYTTERIK